jgi:hypothetical protein
MNNSKVNGLTPMPDIFAYNNGRGACLIFELGQSAACIGTFW